MYAITIQDKFTWLNLPLYNCTFLLLYKYIHNNDYNSAVAQKR